jgi:ABC-type glycerol-3-phosphate transport system permease component
MGVIRYVILAIRWVIGEVHNGLPAQVVMIPQYNTFQKINLVNTFIPLMLQSYLGTTPFLIYLMEKLIHLR